MPIIPTGFTTPDSSISLYNGGLSYFGDESPMYTLAAGGIWVSGHSQFGQGFTVKAPTWGTSILTLPSSGLGTPDFGTCSFDLTGGAYENYLTAIPTGGWTFAAIDEGKIIVFIGGTYPGAVALIEEIIDGTHIRLETCGWDDDVAAGQEFMMINESVSIVSKQLIINNLDEIGEFENIAIGHTGSYVNKLKLIAGADGATNLKMTTDAAAFNNVDSVKIEHVTGALANAEISKVIRIDVDETDVVGDSTTDIDLITLNTTRESAASVHGIHVGVGFTDALQVDSSPELDPDYGYTFTDAFAVTDRINSAGAGDNSFINIAVDVQMFTADNYGILIGNDNKFGTIAYAESISASGDIIGTFEYSTGNGTWSTLTVSDITNGFRNSGNISFNPPSDWAVSNKCDGVTGDITSAYYVRIVRTRNNIVTPPTEDHFKIYEGSATTDFAIRGDGTIQPATLADAAAANNSIYYSTDQSKLVFKDPGGTVRDLY